MRVTIVFLLKTFKARQDGSCPIYVRVTHKKRKEELNYLPDYLLIKNHGAL